MREGTDEENRSFWTVDGGRIWMTSEKIEGKQDQWRWLKLGSRTLAPGEHRFLTHHYYKEDFHFDRIGVLPHGAEPPTDIGPDTTLANSEAAVIETREVRPPEIAGFAGAEAKGDLNGGAVTFEASTDGGTTWLPAPGGDLSAVPVAESIRLRATLTTGPGGTSPEVTGVSLTVRPEPEAWLQARNDFVRVLLEARTGRLFRLTDVERDRELLWPSAPMGLFEIDLKKRGELGWLRYTDEKTFWVERDEEEKRDRTEENARAEGFPPDRADAVAGAKAEPAELTDAGVTDDAVWVEFQVEEDVKLRLSVTLDDTGQSLWRAEITNDHPQLDVIRLRYPILPSVRLGGTGMDDYQLRCQTFGHGRARPGLNAVRDEKYPGGVALPWESIHDDEGGLGVIARDPEALNTGFESKANVSDYFEDVVTVGPRKYHCVASGEKTTWEYGVTVHPGQWHWTADRYREWALQHFERPRYPEWFAENDGFQNCGMQFTGHSFNRMGEYAERAKRIGLNHVQAWGQFTGPGGGCCGPYWMPSPILGTPGEFKQGIDAIHEAGLRVGFFHLHDRLDLYHALGSHIYGMIPKEDYPPGTEFPSHEFFEKHHWIGKPDGATSYPLSEEQWDDYRARIAAYEADPEANKAPLKWHPVDIASPDWWEYMRHWAIDKYVEEWGADGHYFDVLGCGTARESFDLRKGHHGHSMSGPGKAGIPRTTTASARERGHEDYFLLMEGMCDVPGQWTAGMISGLYYNHSESVRYTWPDFVLFEGHSNSGHNTPIKALESAFLNGNRFDIVHSNETMAKIVRARASVRDWIYRGRFMDTLGLDSPVPARLFVRRDPGATGVAITFVNRDGLGGKATLDPAVAGDVRSGIAIDDRGRMLPVPVAREGDLLTFDVPDAYLCTAILPAQVSPEHAVVAVARQTSGQIEIETANLATEAISATITPGDLGPLGKPDASTLNLAGGETEIAAFDVAITPDFWQFIRADFDVSVGGSSRRVATTAFPLMRDPSFEHTGNDEEELIHGAKSLRLDPNEGLYHKMHALNFEPSRRYKVSLSYRRTAGDAQLSGVRIWQRLGKQSEVNQTGADFTVEGEWTRIEMIFDSAPRFVATDLYLYNWKSERTSWIDDVRIEDLGPVPPE